MTDAVLPTRRAAPLVLVLLIAAILFFLYRIAELVLLAFIATLVAVYLGGVVDILCRRVRIPRGPGLFLALFLTLGALSGVAALIAPAVIQQTGDLVASVPRYLTELDQQLRALATRYPELRRIGIASSESGLLTTAMTELATFLRHGIAPLATATGRVLIESIAVVVMALYLAHNPATYRDGILSLVPPRHREAARAILVDLGATLRAWVGAQLLAMVVLAVLTGIGLWLLDVPYWLAFSIFTGVVVMVPFFGTLFSTLLPALLVLGDRGLLPALAVALVGVVVHIVEANFVAPIIMQHRVALPPVLTILSVLVMGTVAGLLGLLVAVPALATVMVLTRHVLLYRVYGERPVGSPEPPPAVLRASREVRAPVPAQP
ncbi:MAG: AI-2E family transporter [Gemmatimonadetes bacterium]|nr:AI-2E family transporter [Gemmatimonadota bacterium]